MLNYFLILLFCVSTTLSANYPEERTVKVVSLGGSCHTAIALRDLKFRKQAFPFDWLISTDHATFIKILDEDFHNFTDEDFFTKIDGVPTRRNLYYNLDFPHDFGKLNDMTVEWFEFKEKYARRIERFRNLRSYKGKVIFVRVMWSQPGENAEGQFMENTMRALDIRNALDQYFPGLDFTLVIWSHTDLDIPALASLDRVVELKVPKAYYPFHDEIVKLIRGRKIK